MFPRSTSAAVLGALVLAATAVPHASAAPGGTGPGDTGPRSGEYTLTLAGADQTWSRAIRLRCPADEANSYHPMGASACADLDSVRGDMNKLKRVSELCRPEYGRLVATISGLYDGTYVEWTKAFRDECVLHKTTRSIFDF
ncbi:MULTISPECIES: SSI family serine proteinase inhibitor [Actinosynnema]|uniref:SSI family serine proteinase inhibitor n=1 Tax=Actinosynnema TaxID=40566 RepID=UPI0020A4FE82|nr:SSI family serine proteinase inhibitor [Actinosynnema pretiosum]MCP2094546.1 Subtilisin inhibitor-like [Actinosynnema pretiosum]